MISVQCELDIVIDCYCPKDRNNLIGERVVYYKVTTSQPPHQEDGSDVYFEDENDFRNVGEVVEIDGREFVEDVEESLQTELLCDNYQEIEVVDRIYVGSFTEMYLNVSEDVENQEQHIINSVVLPDYELPEENWLITYLYLKKRISAVKKMRVQAVKKMKIQAVKRMNLSILRLKQIVVVPTVTMKTRFHLYSIISYRVTRQPFQDLDIHSD
ncbi:unnamed protein product [Lepeophtheirus salmonis]|uniref:(salmon louse) hypothetical protein n=1 Tax=Lepeophtheirus salmonis TaxID=72036 RepID=A0A7R8CHK1_LEPSM|nr:unnamed protein product [Lepeophtheirus salmonis]CAF2825092.1 unnamed protein product [Lepeophtheirus salmonis]